MRGERGEVRENSVEDREGGESIVEWGGEMQNREGRQNNRIKGIVRVERKHTVTHNGH